MDKTAITLAKEQIGKEYDAAFAEKPENVGRETFLSGLMAGYKRAIEILDEAERL